MPGRSPGAAVKAFTSPLQQNISCLSPSAVLVISSGGGAITDKIHSLTLAMGPIRLRGTRRPLTLGVGIMYDVIRTSQPSLGPYKIRTRAYDYAIRDENERAMASYHWHPLGASTFTAPHLHHPPMFPRVHFPTQRISLEEVIRMCIVELGAEVARDDWDDVLTTNESAFKLYRSWAQEPELAVDEKSGP